ncbi:hypothetical protein CVT24_003782 [Panaeolus cyanescens]|uniref:Uncharacterized protein n=1 Tax=Panaeolus cyanescens TaxID=181874 RepID=A0A409VUT1_9AGAR|nr:hypothetical protein CVT24_003782 [Panaeolus cyanescens]
MFIAYLILAFFHIGLSAYLLSFKPAYRLDTVDNIDITLLQSLRNVSTHIAKIMESSSSSDETLYALIMELQRALNAAVDLVDHDAGAYLNGEQQARDYLKIKVGLQNSLKALELYLMRVRNLSESQPNANARSITVAPLSDVTHERQPTPNPPLFSSIQQSFFEFLGPVATTPIESTSPTTSNITNNILYMPTSLNRVGNVSGSKFLRSETREDYSKVNYERRPYLLPSNKISIKSSRA